MRRNIRNGKIRNTYEIDLNNWFPFINAANNKSVDIANDVDLAEWGHRKMT